MWQAEILWAINLSADVILDFAEKCFTENAGDTSKGYTGRLKLIFCSFSKIKKIKICKKLKSRNSKIWRFNDSKTWKFENLRIYTFIWRRRYVVSFWSV